MESDKNKSIYITVFGCESAGKSTLTGHLTYKTGGIDKRTIDKFEKQCNENGSTGSQFAYITDRMTQERNLRCSQSCSYIQTSLGEKGKMGYLYCIPSNLTYIRMIQKGMVSGDFMIFVVSVDQYLNKLDELFEKLLVAYSYGYKRMLFAINKMEKVSYSEKEYTVACSHIKSMCIRIGIDGEESCFVPLDALSGINLDSLSNKTQWYSGHTVLSYLQSLESPFVPLDTPFIGLVKQSYKISGIGIVTVIKFFSGISDFQSCLWISSLERKLEVCTIERSYESISTFSANECVGINFKHISKKDIKQGDLICDRYGLDSDQLAVKIEVRITHMKNQSARREKSRLNPAFKKNQKLTLYLHATKISCIIDEFTVLPLEAADNSEPTDPQSLYSRCNYSLNLSLDHPKHLYVHTYNMNEVLSLFTVLSNKHLLCSGYIHRIIK